ncbi:serine/threonine-protein kinase TBK1-like isoform X3 [Asterias amurensis]|uniref:serine/threonine-protein kinase TBK1-like isoform X3 n=1 Tax=Asterias amurensis TaxID=7602 RepID=UPI003AB26F51
MVSFHRLFYGPPSNSITLCSDMFSDNYPPAQREPKQLRSTLSYIYYTDDKKGEGATGSVFGGREKKSGEKVAVKVFNNVSYRRPGSVQDREFDVLLKLKNPNIVKLLAIEEDQISKERVIVMELCTGGSLFSVLDRPENSFGVPEEEFLIIIRDISNGMKHLQDKGIVHRDLKPGNIMCCRGPDGRSVYKLADFGAARELAEGENFVSLYGTEEYLHPDIYERAVLRRPLMKTFTSSVDLWSIGITLFHAASGMLPFRPFGGRRNRNTMHKMTTMKASGIISGVQRDSEDGPITWSRELPMTTQLSQGLRCHVEELLAGLLESDVNKMWSFQTFHEFAQSLVNKTVLNVFHVTTSQLLKVYINPTHSFAEFKEHIAMQTFLQSQQQILLFNGDIFYPDASLRCQAFPETSITNPILLFGNTFDGTVSPVITASPTIPQVPSRYSLETDAPRTKRSISALFYLKRKQERLLSMQKLMDKSIEAFTRYLKDSEKLLSYHLRKLDSAVLLPLVRLQYMQERISTLLEVTQAAMPKVNRHRDEDLAGVCDNLEIVYDEVVLKNEDADKLFSRYQVVSAQMQSVQNDIVQRDALAKSWVNQCGCRTKDRCIQQFNTWFKIQLGIYANFQRDSRSKSLPYNEEQIHKMEKIKFNETTPLLASIVNDHCESNWRSKHGEMMEWLGLAYSQKDRLSEVDKCLTPLVAEVTADENIILKLGERCRELTIKATQCVTFKIARTFASYIGLEQKDVKINILEDIELRSNDGTFPTDRRSSYYLNEVCRGSLYEETGTQTEENCSQYAKNYPQCRTGLLDLKRALTDWEPSEMELKQSQEMMDKMNLMSMCSDNTSLETYN